MGTDQAPDCVSIMTIYRILLTMHVCVKKKERERERERERAMCVCMYEWRAHNDYEKNNMNKKTKLKLIKKTIEP